MEFLVTSGITDNVLSDSLAIVTGSPAFKFNSFTHFFGNEITNVDFPVNCILRTSLFSGYIDNTNYINCYYI